MGEVSVQCPVISILQSMAGGRSLAATSKRRKIKARTVAKDLWRRKGGNESQRFPYASASRMVFFIAASEPGATQQTIEKVGEKIGNFGK
jgi:hypothetical protein